MTKILLQFYKTESHYRGDATAFIHELNVEILPKVNKKFHYTQWMFDTMDVKAQKNIY